MTLLVVVLIAVAAVALAPVAVRMMDRTAGWPLAGLLLLAAGLLARELPGIVSGTPLTYDAVWVSGLIGAGGDVTVSLRADGLGVFFALLALVIGAVVFIYSAAYLPKKEGNTSFYTIMTAFTASVLLLVLANDAVVLFIAWELVSIASFLLIARSGSGGEAGSMRTLILTFFGGLTLLAALAIAATSVGSTNIQEILSSDVWGQRPGLTTLVALLVATSAFTKAAQFPFHFWLPEAMAAATPVSAFLHAAAVVKAGIYLLIRFSTVFSDVTAWQVTLICVGMATAIMSAIFAVQKTDLKHLTAYSTVSHLGWIVATIGVGTPFAIAAALVHTLAHALFKSSLFMLIGVVDHQAGSRDIRRLGKLYDKMPFTFGSVVIAAASMAAVPPLFGFVSKESMLTAFEELGGAAGMALLITAGVAALLTFIYSAKIVFGAFVDGPRDMSDVKEAPVALWLPAALPGLMSVVVPLLLARLNAPIDAAVASVAGPGSSHSHLALWHGITAPLIVSVLVLILGVVATIARKRYWPAFEGRAFLPFDGNGVLAGLQRALTALGRVLGSLADSLNPTRHMAMLISLILALGFVTLFGTKGVDGIPLAPRADGLDSFWYLDLVPFLVVVASVAGLVVSRSRLTAAVLVGTVGVGISLQMLLLGAPDVALTQFLVESLTVIVIFLALRHQPRSFPKAPRRRSIIGAVAAVATGVVVFAAVYGLLGRHDRSELAMWYIDNAYDIAGGNNIVAVIIVEFRGFDTLGELSVLGMAAVVLAAFVSTMPRYPFLRGTHPNPFGQSQLNSLPLKKALKLATPVLAVLSVLIFFRGHTAPGGGFVAALVMATAFGMSYMSQGSDGKVVSRRTPIYLTGVGIAVAISAGFLGLLEGGFLYAIHGHVLGQHLTTSLIFDGGIYLCVLGMLTMAINALGGYLRAGVGEAHELNYLAEHPDPDSTLGMGQDFPEDTDEDFPRPINPADSPKLMFAAKEEK
ncbi:DUF4040 family protein [Corynebacterium uterequi]|uniref:CPA3 family monovalent cation:proton (H+) antiporter-3 subunit A n=1 Tax=Corynebacterium uterequi TaxID=1072256 RepID=A0A0G3HBW9_9CORY|nr:DUF4040 family protein [Corynebacterium uterequi]AKK10180.1 CPA3 family monovalent cation:proton (H+) antiporter-3 subunit A [Corynebacterium uterequi]